MRVTRKIKKKKTEIDERHESDESLSPLYQNQEAHPDFPFGQDNIQTSSDSDSKPKCFFVIFYL